MEEKKFKLAIYASLLLNETIGSKDGCYGHFKSAFCSWQVGPTALCLHV